MQTVLSALLNYMETSVAVSISCIHERYKAYRFGSAGEDSRAEIPGYACQESRSGFSSSSLICSQGIVRRHMTTYSDFSFSWCFFPFSFPFHVSIPALTHLPPPFVLLLFPSLLPFLLSSSLPTQGVM